MGAIASIALDHARRLIDLFGEDVGLRQMRKWVTWYTKGFRGSAVVRGELAAITTLERLEDLLARLDPSEPFPLHALRAGRAKAGKRQRVKLPEGYLEHLDDDSPPRGPHTPEEIEAWERALGAG